MRYANAMGIGIDENGNSRKIAVDEGGHQIVPPYGLHVAHAEEAFSISKFFGDTADDASGLVLLVAGSAHEIHFTEITGDFEGFWELQAFYQPEVTANGTALLIANRKLSSAVASDASAYSTPTLVATTVDAASSSGQKVLNVTATDGFVAGGWIRIDDGEVGVANNEMAQIDTIQAGVSLTLVENLVNSYTNESVTATGYQFLDKHAEGGQLQKIAGASQSDGNWIIAPGDSVIFRMTNRAGTAARGGADIAWLEDHIL